MAIERSDEPSKAPSPRPKVIIGEGLVAVDQLRVMPRRSRASRFDPIAAELIKANNPDAAKIYNVPEGRDLAKHRSQVYVAMQRSLEKQCPDQGYTVTVRVLVDRQFGISITKN